MRSLAAAALAGAALALSAAGPVDSASADNWNIRRASPPGIINDDMHRSWLRNERTGGEVLVKQEVDELGHGRGSGRYG